MIVNGVAVLSNERFLEKREWISLRGQHEPRARDWPY